MFCILEQNPATRCSCKMTSLCWKGSTPASEKDKPYIRKRGLTSGWLAAGNEEGVISVTYTSVARKSDQLLPSSPFRKNFNLVGCSGKITSIHWNEPCAKLAACDENGMICVWMLHQDRWSLEFVNDRGGEVCQFSWSHDGRMVLICYADGYILVGSVGGQQFWSTTLDFDNGTLLTGSWTPDDKQVLLGTSSGQLILMDVHGAVVSQMSVEGNKRIKRILWSSDKFKMANVHESTTDMPEDKKRKSSERRHSHRSRQPAILTVTLEGGKILLMKTPDDLSPKFISSQLEGACLEWSDCGSILAVGGSRVDTKESVIKFYFQNGSHRFTLTLPTQEPVVSLTWGHAGRRLFVAAGEMLFVAQVFKEVASLQTLACQLTASTLKKESLVNKLSLPQRLKTYVSHQFEPTVKTYLPNPFLYRSFVMVPPAERLYCTMKKVDEDPNCYILYLEFLGGLIPLLKGKRIGKLKTEFVIFEPAECIAGHNVDLLYSGHPSLVMGVQKIARLYKNCSSQITRSGSMFKDWDFYNALYEGLSEKCPMMHITSNIWGTRYKMFGMAPDLPYEMGIVTYRTSLLHLQPRQMTVVIPEIGTGKITARPATPLADLPLSEKPPTPCLPSWPHEAATDFGRVRAKSTSAVSRTNQLEEGEELPVDSSGRDSEQSHHLYQGQGARPKTGCGGGNRRRPEVLSGSVRSTLQVLDSILDSYLSDGEEEEEEGELSSSSLSSDGGKSSDEPPAKPRPRPQPPQDPLPPPGYRREYRRSVRDGGGAVADLPGARLSQSVAETDLAAARQRFNGKRKQLGDLAKSLSCDDQVNLDLDNAMLELLKERPGKHSSSSSSSLVALQNLVWFTSPQAAGPVGAEEDLPLRDSGASPEEEEREGGGKRPGRCSATAAALRAKMVRCSSEDSTSTVEGAMEVAGGGRPPVPGQAPATRGGAPKKYKLDLPKMHVMHNKAPLWNESTQVYQLDFGGRVTQESAKNFQIELRGHQVLQFGRIDSGAYSLDFQHPFSPVQAFGVALANITQRLK